MTSGLTAALVFPVWPLSLWLLLALLSTDMDWRRQKETPPTTGWPACCWPTGKGAEPTIRWADFGDVVLAVELAVELDLTSGERHWSLARPFSWWCTVWVLWWASCCWTVWCFWPEW